jgi:hypothetical protein
MLGRRVCLVLAWATLSALPAARAEESDADDEAGRRSVVLDANSPPWLSGLSHRGWMAGFEFTLAGVSATDPVSSQPIETSHAYAYAARWLFEAPLHERVWYMGATAQVAAAAVPAGQTAGTGGNTVLFGNPEIWGRGLWSSEVGLSSGGGLGLVLPVPRRYDLLEEQVVRVIRVVRPADFSHFQDLVFTARPFFDARHVAGIAVLQLRQGIDFSVLFRDPGEREHRTDLSAFGSLYLGVTPFEQLTIGLEASEVYQLTADVSTAQCLAPCDQQRIQVTLSPSMRLNLPPLSPALSLIIPLSTPLRGEVASYIAGRLHLEMLLW